jgi:hypothetical protein
MSPRPEARCPGRDRAIPGQVWMDAGVGGAPEGAGAGHESAGGSVR